MNKILQKRIDEAALDAVPSGARHTLIRRKEFIKGATFALQNQWISVEEALPEEDTPNCFVAYKTFDRVFYSTGSYEKDIDEWYVDSVGFNANVTHWMPIPSLRGGEE